MAYQVDKFNGTFLTSVADGTIDTTTDLRFVGKNYAGYGEVQNENFLHLMENFANTSAPPKVITGQIWYDSGEKKLRFYNGTRWKSAGGAEVSSTAPSGLAAGEFWWDTTTKQLYSWSGTDFILVGPQASPDLGVSGATTQVVKDTLNTSHYVVKLISNSEVIAVISDSNFTLDTSVDWGTTFPNRTIKRGITLAKTTSAGVTTDGVIWGTSSNALKLGGIDPSEYIIKGAGFTGEQSFDDDGFQLGGDNNLRVRVDTEDVIIENRVDTNLIFRITVTESPADIRDVQVITRDAVVPGDDNTFDLGATSARWSNIYGATVTATSLAGSLTGNSSGIHTGNVLASDTTVMINATTKEIGYDGAAIRGNLVGSVQGNLTGVAADASKLNAVSPSIAIPSSVDKTSVPIRDSSGNISATQFVGIADKVDRMIIDDSATDPTWTSTVSTHYRSAMTSKTALTIAARDASGNLLANIFDGTATAAQYADLAEKYLPDAEYEAGTVMMIGGDAEVTASTWGKRAIGVISTNPAYMMNKDLEGGVYVALKGRVPVKVIGRIKKGEDLIAADNGCAMMAVPHASRVFAVALESNDDEGVKVIEALIL